MRRWLPSSLCIQPSLERGSLTNAAVFVGIGLEWNRGPRPNFVQPGCTATTSRIPVGEISLARGRASLREGEK